MSREDIRKSGKILIVPRTRTQFFWRAFTVAAPSVWNALPADVQLRETVVAFKKHLFKDTTF